MKEIVLNTPDQPCFIGAWYLPQISICDQVVAAFHSDLLIKEEGRSGGNKQGIVQKNIKDSIDAELSNRPDIADDFTANLLAVLQQYKQKFSYSDDVETFIVDHLNIQKYPKGGGFPAWHYENTGYGYRINRHLVFMTYLNDVLKDGETEFMYQKIKIKPEKGLTLIWPATWEYTHRGNICPDQEKYILTGWYSYKNV